MKQFIIIAYDAKDEGALERRMAARAAHVETISRLRAEGKMLCGIAITDDNDKMIGSVCIYNVASRSELDAILEKEPYIIGKVWNDIRIMSGQLGPSFADLLKKE